MSLGDTIFKIGVLVDPLNVTLLFMVPLVASMIFVYAIGYMAHEPASIAILRPVKSVLPAPCLC